MENHTDNQYMEHRIGKIMHRRDEKDLLLANGWQVESIALATGIYWKIIQAFHRAYRKYGPGATTEQIMELAPAYHTYTTTEPPPVAEPKNYREPNFGCNNPEDLFREYMKGIKPETKPKFKRYTGKHEYTPQEREFFRQASLKGWAIRKAREAALKEPKPVLSDEEKAIRKAEGIRKMAEANRGKVRSEETKAKMREARARQIITPESRRKAAETRARRKAEARRKLERQAGEEYP